MAIPIAIAAARAAVAKKHKAAVAKVSRLKKAGVDLAGTEFDVRRNWDTVKRYNRKQLATYMAELEHFTSRTNRFVALADRAPIRPHQWKAFEKAQQQANDVRTAMLDKFGKIKPPNSTTTIGERMDKHAQENPNSVFAEKDSKRENITSLEAMERLMKHNESLADPRDIAKRLRSNRVSAGKMIDEYGDDELSNIVGSLSDEQFDVLWNHTSFRESLIHGYVTVKGGEKQSVKDQITETELEIARDLADWASTLDV